MKTYEYDTVLIKHPTLNSAFIEFPYDVEAEFGTKGQVKVLAAIDGHEYRGSLAKMGHPHHCLARRKSRSQGVLREPVLHKPQGVRALGY